MRLRPVLLLLLLGIAAHAYAAPKWTKGGSYELKTNPGTMATVYTDPTLDKRNGTEATSTKLVDFSKPVPPDSRLSEITVYRFKCAEHKYEFHRATYPGHMATGRAMFDDIHRNDVPNLGYLPVDEGSIASAIYGRACGHMPTAMAEPIQTGSAVSGPPEAAARQLLERRVVTASISLVAVADFKKTDGLASTVHGVNGYVMEWKATLRIMQDCWFNVRTYKAEPGQPGAEILYATNGYQQYKAGQLISFTGSTTFIKKESGWKPL